MDETRPHNSNHEHFKPIPEMVASQEERQAAAESGEAILPGAPKSAEESVLLNTPQYARAIGDVLEPKAITSEQERRHTAKRVDLVRGWVQDPAKMENYFDALHLIGESLEEKQSATTQLEVNINQNLEGYLDRLDSPKAESFGKLLQLATKSPLYGEISKRIIRHFFEKAVSPRQLIDYMYEFGLAAMNEADREIFLYAIKSLCMGTDIMPLSEEKMIVFCQALFTKDELFKRYQEIDAIISHFGGKYVPEDVAKFHEMSGIAGRDSRLVKGWLELKKRSKTKAKQLEEYLNREEGLQPITPEQLAQWPASLTLDPGPLREAFNRRVGVEDQKYLSLRLPGQGSRLFETPVQQEINGLIKSALLQLREPISLHEARDVEFLFSLSPELSEAQKNELYRLNSEIQGSIALNWAHAISPRGDKIKIVDSKLKTLGFDNFIFEIGEPKSVTAVTAELGKVQILLDLDENYTLREHPTGKDLHVSFERRVFLEHVILSHLKEIMCTDRVVPGDHDPKPGRAAAEKQKFTDRRGHKRLLPKGHRFSETARLNALSEERPVDLIKINWELVRSVETGLYTYVKPVDKVAVGHKQPLVSRAPHAMDAFYSLVKADSPPEVEG